MLKVLLVDNEEEVIDTFRFVLAKSLPNVELLFAESGYDAMAIIDKEKPQVVLSDYRMEDGDGGSLAHYCVSKNIPCVILTSFSTADIIPYIPEGTLVMAKMEVLKKGRLLNLVNSMLSHQAS